MTEKKRIFKELYDCSDGAEWTTLEKIKDREKENFEKFRLEEEPYRCGCWDHCDCRKTKLVFGGWRLETDLELKTRLQKEENDVRDRELKQKEYDRQTYERLKKEFES